MVHTIPLYVLGKFVFGTIKKCVVEKIKKVNLARYHISACNSSISTSPMLVHKAHDQGEWVKFSDIKDVIDSMRAIDRVLMCLVFLTCKSDNKVIK